MKANSKAFNVVSSAFALGRVGVGKAHVLVDAKTKENVDVIRDKVFVRCPGLGPPRLGERIRASSEVVRGEREFGFQLWLLVRNSGHGDAATPLVHLSDDLSDEPGREVTSQGPTHVYKTKAFSVVGHATKHSASVGPRVACLAHLSINYQVGTTVKYEFETGRLDNNVGFDGASILHPDACGSECLNLTRNDVALSGAKGRKKVITRDHEHSLFPGHVLGVEVRVHVDVLWQSRGSPGTQDTAGKARECAAPEEEHHLRESVDEVLNGQVGGHRK